MWVLLLSLAVANAALPPWIKTCKTTDPKLNDCIKNTVTELKPQLKSGIPELAVPPLDPLVVPHLVIDRPQEKFNATSYNFTASGIADFVLNDVQVDIEKLEMIFKLTLPEVRLSSEFDIDAVLVVPLKGHGSAIVFTENSSMDIFLAGKRIKKNGVQYLKFDKIEVTLKFFGKTRVQMKGLFGDNELLSNALNAVLNENAGEFAEAVRPYLQIVAQDIILDTANKVTSRFSYEELFPDK